MTRTHTTQISTSLTKPANNHGFTLLELMVALVIFAMLSLAGWQIFDGLNRAKDRAKMHANALSNLQYAYLQLQNDFNQVVAWQTVQMNYPSSDSHPDKSKGSNNNHTHNHHDNENSVPFDALDFFEMSATSLSFIRFADPDPRYQVSLTLVRVEYLLVENRLIRRQYLNTEPNAPSIDSVLLTDISEVNWQARLPEPVATFSSKAIADNNQKKQAERRAKTTTQTNQTSPITGNNQILPKGVGVTFSYLGEEIEWLFVLPKASPALASQYSLSVQADDNIQPPANKPTDSTSQDTSSDEVGSGSKSSGSESSDSKQVGSDPEQDIEEP